MDYSEHVHIRRILGWYDSYRAGSLDAFGLAQNLFAISGAIEGDVPIEIRHAVESSAEHVDGISFGSEYKEKERIDFIANGFEALVRNEIPLESWRSIYPDWP